ncbi:hypothetical protein ALC60_02476 [Trachymyrmex zeteki]|uniref:Uncharacterized protein n=1 Tax=Mycetomoellerius zeteki TaxID=64791 RepID=A0A151XDR8_9HYME|nr:hypothetical protein ALC60_02476 [Trachymyrmex zeteki]
MCTDKESRRTSVTSFSLQTLMHLVNIPSLLVEALPCFERQRQFVFAMISQGDLHVTRTLKLTRYIPSSRRSMRCSLWRSTFFQSFVQAGINKTDRIHINCGVYNISKIEEGSSRPPLSKNFERVVTPSKVSMVKLSLSSTLASHLRFSRPLTYIKACQETLRHGTCKNIMRENGSFSQHRYFLHDKFLSNDESLQIHKR